MTKRTSAKYKLDRRMGENVFGRPKSPVNRREYGPGQHGQRRKGKVSDFGIQLRAKQKLKGYYGDITEKQFKRTYSDASAMKGDASQNLIGLLERRLDMIVYRAKFAPTIWAARQLVSHGHIRVNGVKCNIASRRVDVGDVIELGPKAQEMALVIEAQSLAERDIPDYVVPDGTTKVDLHPRAQARRSALSGADGAQPRDRILLALIRAQVTDKRGGPRGVAFFVARRARHDPAPLPEWAPHEAVWIGFPSDPELWLGDLKPAEREVAAFAEAVHAGGKGEKVWLVAAHDGAADAARELAPFAEVIVEPFGDIWLRDTGPIVVGSGQAAARRRASASTAGAANTSSKATRTSASGSPGAPACPSPRPTGCSRAARSTATDRAR